MAFEPMGAEEEEYEEEKWKLDFMPISQQRENA
jgi:hypothetical protein